MIRTWTPESENPTAMPGTDYHTVKAWFKQLRNLDDEIVNIQMEVHRLRDNATKCTANMSGLPGGSGYGDKIATYAERADVEERRKQVLESELHAAGGSYLAYPAH